MSGFSQCPILASAPLIIAVVKNAQGIGPILFVSIKYLAPHFSKRITFIVWNGVYRIVLTFDRLLMGADLNEKCVDVVPMCSPLMCEQT